MIRVLALTSWIFAACASGGAGTDEADGSTDADADADADTDSGSDADADTDTGSDADADTDSDSESDVESDSGSPSDEGDGGSDPGGACDGEECVGDEICCEAGRGLSCIDPVDNDSHCGDCGIECGVYETCVGRTCVDVCLAEEGGCHFNTDCADACMCLRALADECGSCWCG